MTSYQSILRYLYGLQGRGMKFGLRNIKALLKSTGNPERKFLSIHIAGTNGKGSTASFLASIFMEAGSKTALYTSPHLVRFTERIRINGNEIPEERLVEYARQLRPMIDSVNATFFEATTCIAFQYFADEGVDIAIVEAGLGGRLDSTNVLHPLASIITNVSYDHMEYLGTTLRKIAREKGGIIKRNVPCVLASENPAVIDTIQRIAKRKGSTLIRVRKAVQLTITNSTEGQSIVRLRSKHISISKATIGLRGLHQVMNAATAVAAADAMMSRHISNTDSFARISSLSVLKGLKRVGINSKLRGRLERVGKRTLLDVAHNVAGMHMMESSISPKMRENLIVVFGVMSDKEYPAMCEIVATMASHVVAVKPQTKRALPSAEIVKRILMAGVGATNGGSVRKGIEIAFRLAGDSGTVLITGSHYVVGEALPQLPSNA